MKPLYFHVLLCCLAPGVASTLRANAAEDLARIHVEAIGGKERIAALKAMRARGQVIAGGKRMQFMMVAARPNRIRIETEQGGRTLVQASDGTNPPWEFDTGEWPPRYREMAAASAKTFSADAEFDDPLVAGSERGFEVESGGEVEIDRRKMPRLIVTRRLIDTFSLVLDPDTFFIVRRIENRKSPLGQPVQVVTHFRDYRPVEGVLVPHDIALVVDGKTVQHTRIESVEPNPEIADDLFERPRAVTLPKIR